MNKIKIYILEDEIITQELLKETLEELNYTVCGMASNAVLALKEITVFKPDIVLLDIKVDGSESGIWLGNKLDIPIIYLTAFNDHDTIKRAVITKPCSYLVKPFNTSELYIAIQLAIDKIKNTKQIIVKERDKNIIIPAKDILYAKKEDQYLKLYLLQSEKLIRASVKEFLEQVGSQEFLQVHRSFLVNTSYIQAFNNKEVSIQNYKIPVSKKYSKNLTDTLS